MNVFTATSDWRILPPQARHEPPILNLGAQLIVFRAFLMPRLKLIIANFHPANLASLPNHYQVTSCPACCGCQASSVQCMHCILARTIQGRLGRMAKLSSIKSTVKANLAICDIVRRDIPENLQAWQLEHEPDHAMPYYAVLSCRKLTTDHKFEDP